jgi:S-adenosylmethionine/arginine decarboxylase-like enzyme
MTFVPYHQHLIVRGFCEKPFTTSNDLNKWFVELVNKVEMEVVAGPTSVYVDEEGNEGITGTVTLATSHSSMHIWDHIHPSLFQFDIYSCKKYDIQTVFDHLDVMKVLNFDWITIDRNDDVSVVGKGTGYGTTYE